MATRLKPGIQINRIFNIDIAIFEKSILILLGQYIDLLSLAQTTVQGINIYFQLLG